MAPRYSDGPVAVHRRLQAVRRRGTSPENGERGPAPFQMGAVPNGGESASRLRGEDRVSPRQGRGVPVRKEPERPVRQANRNAPRSRERRRIPERSRLNGQPRRMGGAGESGSSGGTRTPDTVVNSHLLYQLSYRGSGWRARCIASGTPVFQTSRFRSRTIPRPVPPAIRVPDEAGCVPVRIFADDSAREGGTGRQAGDGPSPEACPTGCRASTAAPATARTVRGREGGRVRFRSRRGPEDQAPAGSAPRARAPVRHSFQKFPQWSR